MDFDTKFNILHRLIVSGIEIPDNITEELRSIVADRWAEELESGGFYIIYEHIMYHEFKPVTQWTPKELIAQIIEDSSCYWEEKTGSWTDLESLVSINYLIDKTYSVIDLIKLGKELNVYNG